jgi:DNA repair photolyase
MPIQPVNNPPNPWASTWVEWIDAPPDATLKVYEEEAKSALSRNDSPDLPFRYSLNPYRGCAHACAYCYARPSHQYLDFGAGSDFDRKIVVKTNIVERLREQFNKPSWKGELILFSGNTDCYQPLEASWMLTRGCLELCLQYRNPVGIITKGALVRRDIDVLSALARVAPVHVNMSIAFTDSAMARAIEPGAPSPKTRFETIRALADAGVPVGVGVAPILPGLNDDQLVEVLERAYEAGARSAFRTLVRLAPPVDTIFAERLREALPLRAERVLNGIRDTRGGALTNTDFGGRMHGKGDRWSITQQLFDKTCKRLGYAATTETTNYWASLHEGSTFRRPTAQLSLFGEE